MRQLTAACMIGLLTWKVGWYINYVEIKVTHLSAAANAAIVQVYAAKESRVYTTVNFIYGTARQ